jgi:hypothetical protein
VDPVTVDGPEPVAQLVERFEHGERLFWRPPRRG